VIGSTRNLQVWVYPAPADLRKRLDGLSGPVVSELDRDPLSGDCLLFTNRMHPRQSGLALYVECSRLALRMGFSPPNYSHKSPAGVSHFSLPSSHGSSVSSGWPSGSRSRWTGSPIHRAPSRGSGAGFAWREGSRWRPAPPARRPPGCARATPIYALLPASWKLGDSRNRSFWARNTTSARFLIRRSPSWPAPTTRTVSSTRIWPTPIHRMTGITQVANHSA